MAVTAATEVGARTRMREWVRENIALDTAELRQAAVVAFSRDTAMIHEALAFLAQMERSNDFSIDRRRNHRAFQEVMGGQRPQRILEFFEDWYEILDGQSLKLVEMTRGELSAVIASRQEFEDGFRAHSSVLESLEREIPETYSGTIGGFLKKNKQSRTLIEGIVNEYRKETS